MISELNPAFGAMLGGIATTYIFFWALLHLTHDPKEPPLVATTVPFISPILEMMRWSKDFYAHIRERNPDLPVYTLRVPGARLYAINSVDLIPAVHRQWRTISFTPIQIKAAKAGMGASKDAVAVLEREMGGEQGLLHGMVDAAHSTMSNGPELDRLNGKVFDIFDGALTKCEGRSMSVSLYSWIGGLIMRATTDSIYGPGNPMGHEDILEAWEKYHQAMNYILLDILPQKVFFKKAVQAREKLVQSFGKYYADGSYQNGSAYIQQFVAHCIAQNIPADDIPRFLLGLVFISVSNSIPAAFWFLYRIFSDPEVLRDCREEVLRAIKHRGDGTSTIDLGVILTSCPVLMSTWQEVFRLHGIASSVRVVAEDHMLADRYLLKKGGLVMLSARAQHINPEVWGEDALEFNHKRFLRSKTATGERFNPAAFRGFGGGATLCPGRHFAASKIMLLAAMMLVRFDVVRADHENGVPWGVPSTAKSSQAEAVDQPDEDVLVKLMPRAEAEGKVWRLVVSGHRNTSDEYKGAT